MNPDATIHGRRGPFDGLLQIARYNWPQYACGAGVTLLGATWLWLDRSGLVWLRAGVWVAALLAAWWSAASLAASHWIYDRSDLYRWTWIPALLPATPRRWLNLHAGLDGSSAMLRRFFPDSAGTTADFFDGAEMSEPSIERARREQAEASAVPWVDYRQLPFSDQSFEVVFLLFAAHELRRTESRESLMREIHRVLAPSGTVLLVEHARDAANFVAFGPGFFHFQPGSEWRRLAGTAGLDVIGEQRRAPFVTATLLRKPI